MQSFIDWAKENGEVISMFPELKGENLANWIFAEMARAANFHVCDTYPLHCPLCGMEKLLAKYKEYYLGEPF